MDDRCAVVIAALGCAAGPAWQGPRGRETMDKAWLLRVKRQGGKDRETMDERCAVVVAAWCCAAGPAWQGNHGQGVLAKGEAPGRQGQGNHGRQGNARNIDT